MYIPKSEVQTIFRIFFEIVKDLWTAELVEIMFFYANDSETKLNQNASFHQHTMSWFLKKINIVILHRWIDLVFKNDFRF